MTDLSRTGAERLEGFVRVKRDLVPLLGLVALFTALPFAVPDPALLGILTVMFVWLGMNMAWNLVLGYAGMLSFGQVAFFAVGAYAAAILNVHLGWPGWVDTMAGGLAGGIAALLIGVAAIRLRGVYVALVTLAFHEFLRSLVSTDYSGLTGGPNGLTVARYVEIPDLAVQSFIGYAIGLVLFLAVGLCVFLVLRSPIALALVSVRDAEHVASARGVRRTRYQVAVFALSGALGGVLGGFYAHYVGVVSPTLFSFGLVITLLAMIIVGGWGTFWGPIVGTIAITLVSNYVQGALPQYQSIIIAAILVFMVMAFRHGLVGLLGSGLGTGAPRGGGK
jgi:branched-chain amino acid transport system permease protein